MRKERILKLERLFKPAFDVPLLAEEVEAGKYRIETVGKHCGEIVNKEGLDAIAEKRNVGPRLPKTVIVDLLL